MYQEIMGLINSTLARCSSWFVTIFVRSEMVPLYLSMLTIFLCVRFLVAPLVGASMSDFARRSVKDGQSNSSKSSGGNKNG